MRTRMVRMATAFVVAGTLVGGFESGRASAAGRPPIVTGGSATVNYEDVYTIHFTASDPEGDPLTVVTPPVNDDWISCDGGPANDFTCEYSSSRYYDPAPLPTAPFLRTISYSVTDGTSTSTGVWNVTVLPPPTMEITGRPTVTEGGNVVLQLTLSSNTYGSMVIPVNIVAVDTADAEVISTSSIMIDIADGATTAEIQIPIDDDEIDEPTEYFIASVEAGDAIPYRFVGGGNLVTVLDNDGTVSTDTTPPKVAKHRDVVVERGGTRPAWVPYSAPAASDEIDGALSAVCSPASMSMMPVGKTEVTCSATDSAGNKATSAFRVTVRTAKNSAGSAKVLGSGKNQCVAPGQLVWVEAQGYTAGSKATIQLQTSALEIISLQTARADHKGRIRQFVKIPAATAGEADVVIIGPSGNDDLVRMLPVKIAPARNSYGRHLLALLRRCDHN